MAATKPTGSLGSLTLANCQYYCILQLTRIPAAASSTYHPDLQQMPKRRERGIKHRHSTFHFLRGGGAIIVVYYNLTRGDGVKGKLFSFFAPWFETCQPHIKSLAFCLRRTTVGITSSASTSCTCLHIGSAQSSLPPSHFCMKGRRVSCSTPVLLQIQHITRIS